MYTAFQLSLAVYFRLQADIIREWLEHHTWQGVEHFYLTNNDSADRWEIALQPFITAGTVSIASNRTRHAQLEHLARWLPQIKRDSRWVLSIDMDEFAYARPIGGFETIPSFLRTVEQRRCLVTAITLPWRLFGSSGHIAMPPEVRRHFTLSANATTRDFWGGKYVARSLALRSFGIHRPVMNLGYILSGLEAIGNPPSSNDSALPVALNHYPLLSKERFIRVKIGRGSAYIRRNDRVRTMDYFEAMDRAGGQVDNVELKQLLLAHDMRRGEPECLGCNHGVGHLGGRHDTKKVRS